MQLNNNNNKYPNIKFHANPSSGARPVPRGQTNELTNKTKLLVAFRNFANTPKKNTNLVKGTVAKGSSSGGRPLYIR
jgi:hypothetical protein